MKDNTQKVLIFTDLDGTLLDEKYELRDTEQTVKRLLSLGVQMILCSSKTYSEIEHFRRRLSIRDPFISENGAAIFIPKDYFKTAFDHSRETKEYMVIVLGTDYAKLRREIEKVRRQSGSVIVGFGDMSAQEVAEDCGLSLEMAGLAKQREYDEPFRIMNGHVERIICNIEQDGLYVTKGGVYYHLTGGNNKGKSVAILKELYQREFENVVTFGVGNGPNDMEMLEIVDKPFFVQETDSLQDVWAKILGEVILLI